MATTAAAVLENFMVGAFGCGVVESILCAMENFEIDSPLQAAALGTLATILSSTTPSSTSHDPLIQLAVDLNSIPILIKAMESFPDSINVQQNEAASFYGMAQFPQLHLVISTRKQTCTCKSPKSNKSAQAQCRNVLS
jgi:hypothetical protein